LDSFVAHFRDVCGDGRVEFTICPGVVDDRRGYGVTKAFVNCLDLAHTDGVETAFIFEDDARLVDASFCEASARKRLMAEAPEDAFLIMLGGHNWRLGPSSDVEEGYLLVFFSSGAYGFAVPRDSLLALRDGFAGDIQSGHATISPDETWFHHAAEVGRRVYRSDPLLVWHPAGWSNTWGRQRDAIV